MTTRAELSAVQEYDHGHTPLMLAALDGNTEQVKELIRPGAIAVSHGYDEIARRLGQSDSEPLASCFCAAIMKRKRR